MAIRLSGAELARMKADFDAPNTEPPKEEKKRRGNPHGRPASTTPRTSTFSIRLTDAEKMQLEEAARMTGETKTAVIVEGIGYVYSKALAEAKKLERQQAKEGN